MNIKEMPIYLCSPGELKLLKIADVSTTAGHKTGYYEGRLIVTPIKIDTRTINPENLLILKEKFDIEDLLLIDRIKGAESVLTINDHVNISGQNFLRAKTPHEELPQFPDMSKIYGVIEGYKETITHTVGPERFKNQQASKNIIYSELVGLVAPVAHYVGIKVFALGVNKPKELLDII